MTHNYLFNYNSNTINPNIRELDNWNCTYTFDWSAYSLCFFNKNLSIQVVNFKIHFSKWNRTDFSNEFDKYLHFIIIGIFATNYARVFFFPRKSRSVMLWICSFTNVNVLLNLQHTELHILKVVLEFYQAIIPKFLNSNNDVHITTELL